MPIWLPFVLERLKHFGVYILIALVLIGGPYLLYRKGVNVGYKEGYAKAIQEHPPNIYNGPTTVNQQVCPSIKRFGFEFGKVGLGFTYVK